jgi:hypothetical protein
VRKSTKAKVVDLLQQSHLEKDDRLLKDRASSSGKGSGKVGRSQAWDVANGREDAMIAAIDLRRDIEKVAKIFERIDEGKIDVQGLFSGATPIIAKKLIYMALAGESEKNRLDASKHLLALAGHNPAQKHEISRIDPSTPKEALLAMIAGQAQELQDEGIDVVDDRGSGDEEA